MVDVRPVLFIIGLLLSILALAMLLPAVADLADGNPDWQGFALASLITLFFGGALAFATRAAEMAFNLRQAFLLTTASWVIVAGFAALPFLFSRLGLTYADAYFEAMSGLTTTGATVIVGLDQAPPGILWWRGLLQWLGGVGIIAMAIAVFPMLRVGGMQLFRLESSDKSEKVLPRAPQIAAGILIVYVSVSALCAALYWAGGMTPRDAAIHAMTTVSTGGFSTWDDSFAHFDSPVIDLTAIVFMLLGGMTFTLFLRVQRGDWRALARDSQTRWYLAIALALTLAIALWHWRVDGEDPLRSLRHAAFNAVSIMTTTGFVSTDYGQWGALPQVLFFALTFVGGCSGSTAGAIKVFRFQILFAIARTQIHRALAPSGVFVPKYNRRQVTEAVTESVLAFFFLYVLAFAGTAAGLGLTGLDLVTSLSGAAAALGNVGPGLGEVIGPVGSYASVPQAAKWILSFAMLLGRLELVTVVVLLSRVFWQR
ncbi:MAG: TrkH family potassium uptake protein [Pseudomonadota bacterium]